MDKKIWYEMVDIKYGETYLTKYLGLQRNLKRTFKITTLILSLSGVLGWKYFEDIVWIALILIAVIQIFTLVENQLIRSEREIENISVLKMMYTRYFNKLEQLWTEFYSDRITEEQASDRYFELRSNDWEKIEELDGKLNIKRYKRLRNTTEDETNHYINKHHNYE